MKPTVQRLSTKGFRKASRATVGGINGLIELTRLKGLAEFIKKVYTNLNKYAFTKQVYDKMVSEFGGRKVPKTKKLLEELQRSLLFSQISDDQEQL